MRSGLATDPKSIPLALSAVSRFSFAECTRIGRWRDHKKMGPPKRPQLGEMIAAFYS